MTRLSLLGLALAGLCGCAQVQLPALPLGKPPVDPNKPLYDAYFQGPAANRDNIARFTQDSLQLQKKALGVAPDAQIDDYLNGVLARLQRGLPGTPPAARVYATPNTEFSGASYQDGGIYIPYKVLETLESEDELAALIGHEYAHVALGHYATNWINTASTLAYSAGNLYINDKLKTATEKNLVGMVLANNAALNVSQIGLVPALTRDQEEQADRLGSDLLIRAGYSYVGMMNFMSRMQDWDARNQAINEQRRVNYIDLFANRKDNLLANAIDTQIDGLENQLAGLLRKAARNHDEGRDRSKMLRDYLKQHYAGAERPALNQAGYAAVLKSAHAQAFFGGLDQAHAALAALQGNERAQALAGASAASKGPAASVPLVRHALINAMALNGKPRDALQMLEGDVAGGDALFADNLLLLGVLKQHSPQQALALAQRSYDRYDGSPELLPELILLNKQMNNQLGVMKFYGLCASKAMVGANNGLLQSCNKAKG